MLEPRGSKPDLKRSLENGRLESMLFETCPPSLDTPTGPAVTHCDRGPTLKPSGAAVVSNVQVCVVLWEKEGQLRDSVTDGTVTQSQSFIELIQ